MNYEKEPVSDEELNWRKRVIKKALPAMLIVGFFCAIGANSLKEHPILMLLSVMGYMIILLAILFYHIKH